MIKIINKSKILIASLLFIFGGSIAVAYANNGHHQELITRVIMESGLDQQFAGFDQILSNATNQALALDEKLDSSEREHLNSIFVSNFSSQKFLEHFKTVLSTNLTDDELTHKLEVFKDPVVKKFIEAEIASSKPEAMQDFMIYSAKIGQNPPSKTRLELAKRLDKATKASESTKVMMINMFETMVKNMNSLHHKFKEDQLETMINNYAVVVENTISNQIKLSYLYTYRDFSDKELESYIKKYETNPGLVKFNDTLLFAMNDYFDGYAIRVSNDINDFMKLKESSKV